MLNILKWVKSLTKLVSIFEKIKWKAGRDTGKYVVNKKGHVYLQIQKRNWCYIWIGYNYRQEVGNGGIPQRGKLLSQHMKEELKESFVRRGYASSNSRRQEKARQTWEMRATSVSGAQFWVNGLGLGRRHKSSSFVPLSIHLAHTVYFVSGTALNQTDEVCPRWLTLPIQIRN